MTQRSAERWNTGKRGASQRRAEKKGFSYASDDRANLDGKGFLTLPAASEMAFARLQRERKYKPYSPRLAAAFRRGAWKWVESQPVEF